MNSECKAIHETILGDVIDAVDYVKNSVPDDYNPLSNKSKTAMGTSSSIAKASSNLVMVFPVLCSRNIPIDVACMVNKALERNCVSMLQRLFAANQVAKDGMNNLEDYIHLFHKNINTKVASLDDVFRIIDDFSEAGVLNSHEVQLLKEDMQNIFFELPPNVNKDRINRFLVNDSGEVVSEAAAAKPSGSSKQSNGLGKQHDPPVATRSFNNLGNSDSEAIGSENITNTTEFEKDRTSYFSNQVPPSEFKKANELIPTPIVINYYYKDTSGDGSAPPVKIEGGLAAVKCKLYPINSEDIVNHLSDKISDKNWITQFLRASTREISFLKDFVLAIDKAKLDALSTSDRKRASDKMWKVLERRAFSSKMNRLMRQGNGAGVAAITTLMVSQEEVEYLLKYHSIDLEKVGTVSTLFNAYNLMCVVIVDTNLEVAKFIYDDGNPMWEVLSFSSLEKESNDKNLKQVINLISRLK